MEYCERHKKFNYRSVTQTSKTKSYNEAIFLHIVWHHWRWFITSIVCDTVAEEELEGCSGKKNSTFPCLYDRECQRLRLSLDTYGFQQMKAPVPIAGKQRFSVVGEPLNFLNPNRMYRCPSFLFHLGKGCDVGTFLSNNGIAIDGEQVREANTIRKVFSLFSYSFIHQYLPTTLSPVHWIRYRIQKVRNVCRGLPTEDVLSQDVISNNQIDVTLDSITEEYLMCVRIPSKDHFIGLSKNHHCCFSHPHYHPVETFIPNYPQTIHKTIRL